MGRKLAAKSAADVVLMHANIAGRDFQWLGHLRGNAGNVLCGYMYEQLVIRPPLGSRSMTFETTMRDHRNPIQAFGYCRSLRKCLVRIALRHSRRLLIKRLWLRGCSFVNCGRAKGLENVVGGAVPFGVVQHILGWLER